MQISGVSHAQYALYRMALNQDQQATQVQQLASSGQQAVQGKSGVDADGDRDGDTGKGRDIDFYA